VSSSRKYFFFLYIFMPIFELSLPNLTEIANEKALVLAILASYLLTDGRRRRRRVQLIGPLGKCGCNWAPQGAFSGSFGRAPVVRVPSAYSQSAK
jgi:hypothetical protein